MSPDIFNPIIFYYLFYILTLVLSGFIILNTNREVVIWGIYKNNDYQIWPLSKKVC